MGEIKNTQGASSGEDRALAEGEAAVASSSLRDGDPSRIGPRPFLPAKPKFTCKGCPALTTEWWREALENDDSDSGTTARCSAAAKTITHYWRASEPPPSWCPSKLPAQAIEARQGGDAEGGSVEDKSAVAAGDVPASKSQVQPPSSNPGEVERLVDALVKAAERKGDYEGHAAGLRIDVDPATASKLASALVATRTALLSHISTAGRGERSAPAAIRKVDPQVWTAASELNAPQKRQPEWLWFDDGVKPTSSFGRWGKTSKEAPYIRADIVLEIISAADATNPQDQE